MTAYKAFEHTYKKALQHKAFTPYRICHIGAHSNHQLGKITGFAINKGIHIAYGSKENGVIETQSLQFDKRTQWHIETYGKLSFDSGYSSIHNCETGSPELINLYEVMTQTKGIYGDRFSGAGFKGCCLAIIDPAYEESIIETVTKEYLKAFSHLEGKCSAHICESADGVNL